MTAWYASDSYQARAASSVQGRLFEVILNGCPHEDIQQLGSSRDRKAVVVGWFTGLVAAFDGGTGAPLWSANAGARINFPDVHNASMLVGFAESGGTLLVPAGLTLVGSH